MVASLRFRLPVHCHRLSVLRRDSSGLRGVPQQRSLRLDGRPRLETETDCVLKGLDERKQAAFGGRFVFGLGGGFSLSLQVAGQSRGRRRASRRFCDLRKREGSPDSRKTSLGDFDCTEGKGSPR